MTSRLDRPGGPVLFQDHTTELCGTSCAATCRGCASPAQEYGRSEKSTRAEKEKLVQSRDVQR